MKKVNYHVAWILYLLLFIPAAINARIYETWTQPSGVLTGTPNWGYVLLPLYDKDINTYTELDEVTSEFPYSYFGVAFDIPIKISGVRFYCFASGMYWNYISYFKIWALPFNLSPDIETNWIEVVPEKHTEAVLPGWVETKFPSGEYSSIRIIYTATHYCCAPRVGEVEFLTPSTVFYKGVNLACAEFGENMLPGTYNVDYIYPTPTEVDYFRSKGLYTIRLPFRWERLQRELNGILYEDELARMDNIVNYATSKGVSVVLDPHNYARYNNTVIGEGLVTADSFALFWEKLADHYKSNDRVIFGIMNEPHDMSTELWRDTANLAIQKIRNIGAKNLILVPGNCWSGAHSWTDNCYGTTNADAMLQIIDPIDNFAFEVHQYFDTDSSGKSPSCVSSTIGAERIEKFTAWLKQNKKFGFLGEFGIAQNATCYQAMDNMLDYIEKNPDVWIGWSYWAAGPWWGDYMYSIEPRNGADKPQLDILRKYVIPSLKGDMDYDGKISLNDVIKGLQILSGIHYGTVDFSALIIDLKILSGL